LRLSRAGWARCIGSFWSLTGFGILLSARSSGQTPSITWIEPIAWHSGKTNHVKFSGQNLSGPTEMWLSFPTVEMTATLDHQDASATQLLCQVVVPKNCPVGVGALRLATTNGITPFHLFMIDDLTTIYESTTNKTTATAQRIKWPIAVDSYADELAFDYFGFTAKKGEQVSIEVVAQRLGSRLDPVMRVLDKAGREIAYCDDDARVGRDSRLRCAIPSAGKYLIEVRDINYGGGPAFRYRLRVGDFPLTAMPYPPCAEPGTNVPLTILSGQGRALRDMKATVPPGAVRFSLPARSRKNSGSSFVSLFAAEHPQLLEKEPNNSTNTATELKIPSGISARFEQTNDVDVFRFSAGKNQKLVFRATNRSLGSPCDLFMSIQDSKGGTVAEFDPTSADEGVITNTFKEAGNFFLTIEELNQNGGPDLGYHIDAYELQPGFELTTETNDVQGRAGETVTIKISAARRDYDGAISLGLATPLTAEPTTIPEKKNEAELKIKLPPDLAAGTLVHFKIIGTAEISGRKTTATASTLPALRKLWPGLLYPPRELDGLIGIGVRAAASAATEAKREKTRD
jgi:hypothetical protein